MKNRNINFSKSNREFENAYAKILSDFELQLNLFLRNLDGSDKPLSPQNIRGAVKNEHTIELLFLNAYPYNLQLAAPSGGGVRATADLAKYCVDNNVAIRGVNGEFALCSAFAHEYEKLTAKKMRPLLSMDILRLTELNAVEVKGRLRAVNANDQFAVDWIATMIKALRERCDRNSARERFNAMVAERNLFVYENEEGIPVSFAQAKPYGSYATLNYVYTSPEYRSRGYAKQMVHLLCGKILDFYKGAVLFVDKNNPIANKLYDAVGFERVCENYDFRVIE